jgi:hypothetical protein
MKLGVRIKSFVVGFYLIYIRDILNKMRLTLHRGVNQTGLYYETECTRNSTLSASSAY